MTHEDQVALEILGRYFPCHSSRSSTGGTSTT
jgi:hypothetical protein